MKKYLKQYGLLSPNSFHINYKLFFLFAFIFLAMFFSCNVDDHSQEDPVIKFLGTWHVDDQPARLNYNVTIQKDPGNSAYVLLINFADMRDTATGLVVGNSIVIEKQGIGSGYFCNGSGTYKTKYELDFLFTLDDGIETENRKAVFSK